MRRTLLIAFGPLLIASAASAGDLADTATLAMAATETATAVDDEVITPDLEPADESDTSSKTVVPDPNERLEISWPEIEHDAQFDPIAAQELLDSVNAMNPLEPLPKLWPPDPGPSGEHTWDIPLGQDPRIDMWISYFTGAGRERFEIWLSRLTRYAPMFWPVLEQHGLPKDTIFLAMIESGFSTRATSWASAAGPWQFMPATARHYGLEVSFWVDERRDFELSTEAAAQYLKDLHAEFGDWMLAWAAYNTGEGRIRRCVKRTGTTDFWKISRTSLLYRETKHYVPKLIAAALISKQPQKFGITSTISYLPPLDWETITVTTAIDLKTVAQTCASNVTEEDLLNLNPAFYRGITPPGREVSLRVPRGSGASCAMGLTLLPPEKRLTYRYHRVRRGDTAAKIAKEYKTTPELILAFNKVDASRLSIYDAIVVPVPGQHDHEVPAVADNVSWNRHPPFTPLSGAAPMRVHRVRPGDSLWRIARKYGVSLSNLKSWNNLWRSSRLRVGQQLRIGR